jgi:hypothetical protein
MYAMYFFNKIKQFFLHQNYLVRLKLSKQKSVYNFPSEKIQSLLKIGKKDNRFSTARALKS